MEPFRLETVAARVVAWHNQHPLARRITAAQVQSVGYVALPYQLAGASPAERAEPVLDHAEPAPAQAPASEAPASAQADKGSLRERALARARQPDAGLPAALPAAVPALDLKQLRPAFHEDFIAPLKPRQVARWALRQGRPLAAAPADGPLRQVLADAPAAGAAPVMLYLLTAAIEAGPRRSRILLGAGLVAGAGRGAKGAVLGRRLWSLPRVATALLTPLLLAGAGAGLALRPATVDVADHATPVHAEAASAPTSTPEVSGEAHAAADTAPAAADSLPPAAETPVETPAETHAAAPVDSHAAVPATVLTVAHADPHADPHADGHAAAQPSADARTGTQASAHADAHAAVQTAVPPAAAPASATTVATAPLDVEPRRGVIDLPRLGRVFDKPKQVDDKPVPAPAPAAEAHPPAAPTAVQATAVPTTPLPTTRAKPAPAPIPPKPEPPPAAPPPTRTTAATAATAKTPAAAPAPRAEPAAAYAGTGAFAVSTRPLRTRAEAEQTMTAMAALLRTVGDRNAVQVEILANGPDWRVVGWPYQRQGDAEKARNLLAARGMRVAVVGF